MIVLHVLAGGEFVQHVLNAITAFMKQDSFLSLLRMTALIGIIMATVGFLKTRDPFAFASWFVGFLLFTHLILLPKCNVLIHDITEQTNTKVDNVPVVFALSASLITTVGFGLAQSYDALLTMPDDLQYTKTGALFGSRLIQAATQFRIIDPQLKEEMNAYFRNCVVGDIRLNHKYSVGDLAKSTELWTLITARASPLRMTPVNHQLVTCQTAAKADGDYSLKKKLDFDMKKTYSFFGVTLFGKPAHLSYEELFTTRLTSAFRYYQGLTDASSNVFLQSMMINAMKDGASHYQAFSDATAGIVNQQFTKSQVQHRWGWQIAGVKALWFLPLLHTWLTVLLFGVFPLIIALASLPGGIRIAYGYLQFFLSLQFWPVMFAILNAGMTLYGAHQSAEFGAATLVNLDKLDELHQDLSGVAGYMMMLIPFLANGLVSNLGGAFSHLASSMTGHVQSSTMSAAGEAASSSFGLGQTSFYNTTANNFSANKHDANWTHLHGMHTEQLPTGVLKTTTASGDEVFDVSPGLSRNALSINTSQALSASMNQAYEQSLQAANNESTHYQSALSNFAHRAIQLSQLQGHDLRLGDGISASESGQYSKALSTMNHIAEEVAKREGVSKDDAMTHLTSGGWGAQAGLRSDHSVVGKLARFVTGASASADAHLKFERSSTSANRYHTGADSTVTAREAKDFNEALNYVEHFAKTHHFDESLSTAASLSNQLGADLREAQTASHNYDVNLAKAARVSQAKNYMESNAAQMNTNLDQAFSTFLTNRIGEKARDDLLSHPGDPERLAQQQALANEFITGKRDELIAKFGQDESLRQVDLLYREKRDELSGKENAIGKIYQENSDTLSQSAKDLRLGLNQDQSSALQKSTQTAIENVAKNLQEGDQQIVEESTKNQALTAQTIALEKDKATNGVLPFHTVDNALDHLHLKEKD